MIHSTGRCIEAGLRLGNAPKKRRFLESEENRELFEASREEIEVLLTETAHFHGTGARHYAHNGASKYEGTTSDVNDSLQTILQKGLEPKADIYNEFIGTGAETTVSLTERRLYARLYAQYFLHESHQLDYEYGPRPMWMMLFLARMALHHATNTSAAERRRHREIKKKEGRKQWDKIQKWFSAFRGDGKYKNNPLSGMFFAKSDIPENHPVIIGVKPGAFRPVPMKSAGFAAYETRSTEIIPPEKFTHIEVPLAHAQKTREKIAALGLALPVVPIEFAELLDSEKRLWQLLELHQDRKNLHQG